MLPCGTPGDNFKGTNITRYTLSERKDEMNLPAITENSKCREQMLTPHHLADQIPWYSQEASEQLLHDYPRLWICISSFTIQKAVEQLYSIDIKIKLILLQANSQIRIYSASTSNCYKFHDYSVKITMMTMQISLSICNHDYI